MKPIMRRIGSVRPTTRTKLSFRNFVNRPPRVDSAPSICQISSRSLRYDLRSRPPAVATTRRSRPQDGRDHKTVGTEERAFMRLRIVLAGLLVPALANAQGGAPSLLPGERATVVTAIPGVIAADAKWELIWADFETADGIVGTADGGVLFAQEQTDTVRRLDVNGKEYVFVKDSF